MSHFTDDDIMLFETQLKYQRDVVSQAIERRLHQGDQPGQLALANNYADVREQAEADLVGDTDLAQLQLEQAELAGIDEALLRISAGTYGNCGKCGARISLRRLRAQPAARMCLACQEALEKYR